MRTHVPLAACCLLALAGCGLQPPAPKPDARPSDTPGPATTSEISQPAAAPVAMQPAGAPPIAAQPVDNWHDVVVDNGRITIRMPTVPTPVQQSLNRESGTIHFLAHKSQAGGVFFNLNLVTYPETMMAANGGGTAFLAKIGEGNMVQKAGSSQEALTVIEDAGVPAIEHIYRYPAGTNSAGYQYAPGYAVHRMYLLGNQVCWAFVDVVDSYAESNRETVETEVQRFFDSLEIRDLAQGGDADASLGQQ